MTKNAGSVSAHPLWFPTSAIEGPPTPFLFVDPGEYGRLGSGVDSNELLLPNLLEDLWVQLSAWQFWNFLSSKDIQGAYRVWVCVGLYVRAYNKRASRLMVHNHTCWVVS